MTAVDELTAEGVDFVFNTPNANSRPGYLRMGWSTVGPAAAGRRASPASRARCACARRACAAERWPVDDGRGHRRRGTLLADARVAGLLAAVGPPGGLRTARTPEYLRWRYGLPALGYRAIALDDDPARRARGVPAAAPGRARSRPAISDVLVPHGARGAATRSSCAAVARETGADYAIRVGATRRLASARASSRSRARARCSRGGRWPTRRRRPRSRDLDLALGDVELL